MDTDSNKRNLNRENINKDILFRNDLSFEEEKKKEIFDILSKTLEEIFDMFDFNVFAIDEDGIFRFVNEYYAAVAGKPKGEIIGKHVNILLPDSLKENYETGRDSLLKSKYGEKYKDTQAFTSPDNTEHLFNTKKILLPHGNNYYQSFSLGGKQLFFGTGIDVIDFEKAERQLKKNIEGLLETNRKVSDSITYAKNIQNAVLPSDNYIKSCFPDSFVFYKPKSIVSGDFYWFHKTDDEIIAVVSDCTGHGVPGALMSMLGINSLNEIIKEQQQTDPEKILNALNERISRDLNAKKTKLCNDKFIETYDGMDIAICNIKPTKNTITIGLANTIAYIIRNSEIIEIENELSMPIGGDKLYEIDKNFNSKTINIQKNDVLYMLTDGYIDQFGYIENQSNQKRTKFYRKNFRNLIKDIAHLPFNQQNTIIVDTFNTWKGKSSQTDDILVFGAKLPYTE